MAAATTAPALTPDKFDQGLASHVGIAHQGFMAQAQAAAAAQMMQHCWTCNKTGHFSWNCPSNPFAPPPPPPSMPAPGLPNGFGAPVGMPHQHHAQQSQVSRPFTTGHNANAPTSSGYRGRRPPGNGTGPSTRERSTGGRGRTNFGNVNTTSSTTRTCHKCGVTGHFAKDCRRRPSGDNRRRHM